MPTPLMKKYFLHNGTEHSGPFDLDELKEKNISKTTPVWHEGMENWKSAGDIAELGSVFAVVPPPISAFNAPHSTQKSKKKATPQKILGLSKSTFFMILGIIIILIVISILNTFQENRRRELNFKNHKTEVENHQYELEQKEIENQKIIAAEAEKAAAERMLKDKKETDNNRLLVIQQTITDYQINLREAEKKLNNTSSFKLLRTADEKKEQINLLQKNIDSLKKGIIQLQKESNLLQLEIEKTK